MVTKLGFGLFYLFIYLLSYKKSCLLSGPLEKEKFTLAIQSTGAF